MSYRYIELSYLHEIYAKTLIKNVNTPISDQSLVDQAYDYLNPIKIQSKDFISKGYSG
jgi:hypothetical protein